MTKEDPRGEGEKRDYIILRKINIVKGIFLEGEFAKVTDLLHQVPFGDVMLDQFAGAVNLDTVKITDDGRGFYALANHPDSDHYILINKEDETDTILLVIKDRGLVDEYGIELLKASQVILEAGEVEQGIGSKKRYRHGIKLSTAMDFDLWLNVGDHQWMIELLNNISQATRKSYSPDKQPIFTPDEPTPPVQRI